MNPIQMLAALRKSTPPRRSLRSRRGGDPGERGPRMNASRLRRGLPALVVAGALVLSGCEFEGAYDLPLPGSPVDEEDAYQVTAEFDDVLNVVPRSVVMVDDVTVGEVTEVDRIGWHAKVTMNVRDDVELPDNAFADIRQVSLLGEKYVALEAPIGEEPVGRLGDGDKIPLASTGRNPEVEEVLGALSFLLNGGGVGQLGTITQELNNVMSGRTGRVRHLLGSLESVIGTLDQQKAQIIGAMESMNDLATTLNAERKTIGDALDVMGPAISVLADQHEEMMRMLGALKRLGKVGARVIGASKDNLIASLAHLRPVLTKLNAAGESLAPGLDMMISFPFPQEAAEVVKGDYANASIRAGINLESFLGTDNGGGGGGGGGGGPIPLPDPGQVLTEVERCLRSQNPRSDACQDASVRKLRDECKKPRNRDNPVCRALDPLGGGAGGGNGGGGPTVPPLPFPRPDTNLSSALTDALGSGRASPTYAGLFGFEPFGSGGAT
jgi:phospholipid/cholesterol/gamma-HCH transport system substrate-binding protein